MRRHGFLGLVAIGLALAACAVGTPASPPLPTLTPAASQVSPAELHLSGRLIYTGTAESISEYDLATNQISALFEAPRNGFVTGEAVSPDGSQVVFSYAPPPEGSAQLGFSDLYQMPLQKSAKASPLLEGSAKHEVYSYPAWSPDGKYLYFGHTAAAGTDGSLERPQIERMAYPDGRPEVIQKGASYPRLSPDGSRLAYITFEADLSGNELFVADPDGSNALRIVPQADFAAIDSPIFSPDGKSVIFSAVENAPKSQAPGDILSRWLGVTVAYAHNAPSDLWRAPVTGGMPERLSRVGCTGLFASYSPDGQRVAFMCDAGFFVMNPDGSSLGMLNPDGGLGTMEWIR